MKILDYSNDGTEINFSGSWQDWLTSQGYPSLPAIPEDKPTLVLIQGPNDWAIYHPPVGKLKDCELLYARIPTESEAENLLQLCAQLISGPLTLLSGLRSPSENTKFFLISNEADFKRFVDEMEEE